MDIRGIITQYLRESGFDGLFNGDAGCGCNFENGLFPCGQFSEECECGYTSLPIPGDDPDYSFFVTPIKPYSDPEEVLP